MIPVSGSAYTYGYATLGEIFGWIIGWDLILEYMVGGDPGVDRLVGLLREPAPERPWASPAAGHRRLAVGQEPRHPEPAGGR